MFCYQCEQTSKGKGCTIAGVCGKQPDVAVIQDLLTYAVKGLAIFASEGRKVGAVDQEVNRFTVEVLFATLTNVNFDPERFFSLINRAVDLREALKKKVAAAGGKIDFTEAPTKFVPAATLEGMVSQGEEVMWVAAPLAEDSDVKSLQDAVLFGLRGVSAYAYHAQLLGQEDDAVYSFVHDALVSITRNNLSLKDWFGVVLKCGEANLRAMELLDAANVGTYGHPIPTKVPLGHKKGKAILVSGHDLGDMEKILEQSEGRGVHVYTHGEMLSTHGYPKLKKYKHFYGHYGTAWQNQWKEFPKFPGAIVMTTNCIQRPLSSYNDNLFTTGTVGWPSTRHIDNKDFTPVVEKALEMSGFADDEEGKTYIVGHAHNTLIDILDLITESVKNKKIRHIFIVAGCDGVKPERNYYTEFVEKVPKDCVVLTFACGKFKFTDKNLGEISGIPRLLDSGQCNDAHSAIKFANALSERFGVGVNDLPLSFIISWYEQKSVAILLTLLYLGIKDIRLGPSLPAFITPNVLDALVKNFGIKPITNAGDDLKKILE